MAKVSVWLTSYNHGEQLRESIESVLNQSFQDYELVIIDDCSTDQSQDIIREYSRNNPQIKTIFHEKNIGNSGLKDGLVNLEGEYVAILHGDDMWDKSKLEKQVEVLDAHDDIIACFTEVRVIDLEGKAYTGSHHYLEDFEVANRTRYEWLRYFFYKGNCLCHPSLLIRKSAYEQCNLLVSDFIDSLPDFDKWIKLCLAANIYIIPEKLTFFRVHEDETNQSGDTEQKMLRLFLEEYFVYQNYIRIDDIETLKHIFPQAEEYVINGEYVVEFVLAKIFIESPRNSQKLLGFNILYDLLQNTEKRSKVEAIYNYGRKDFNLEKQQFDIFGKIPRERFLLSTLYVDTGDGYNEEECIKKKAYISGSGLAHITYEIQERFVDKEIKNIRFDLDEGLYRKCSIINAEWDNGESAKLKPLNGIRQKGWDCFYTLDPQYKIELRKFTILKLVLKVEVLSEAQVENYYTNMDRERNMLEQKVETSRLLLEEYRSSRLIRMIYRLRKRIKK